jgi:hypothetical protein
MVPANPKHVPFIEIPANIIAYTSYMVLANPTCQTYLAVPDAAPS